MGSFDHHPEYTGAALDERDVDLDPLRQFERWFNEAVAARVVNPHAMTVATATRDGLPSARTVLFRGIDESGIVFYTDYESRKGRELASNPHAALLFYWAELERQVRVTGEVSRLSREDSARYFHSRPRGSQLGAWASQQSRPIEGRGVLDERLRRLDAQYRNRPVPLPPYWGGFHVAAATVEFWQGRPNRLHDRLQYTRRPDHTWHIERLSP